MSRTLLLSGLLLLTAPVVLRAQDPARDTSQSVLRQILSYRETDAEVIAKSRRLLLDCVRGGDTARARSVFRYLCEQYSSSRYLALWPVEEMLLAYWVSDYARILRPAYLESLDTLTFSRRVTPARDLLYDDLREAMRPGRLDMRLAVLRAPVTTPESEFLLVFLEYLLSDRSDPKARDLVNADADAFLSRFGDSPYILFVRRDIRFVLRESPVGYGIELGGGAGWMHGNLATWFTNPGAMDIGGDLSVRKLVAGRDVVFYLRGFLGFGSEVRAPFTHDGDWPQGMKQDAAILEGSAGIVVYESDVVQVAPFAGIGGIFISPPTDANGNKTSSLELNLFSWAAGLNADWKIASGSGLFSEDAERSYWLIRTRLTFNTSSAQSDPRFNGNIVTFTVGVGMFGRAVVREF